jgi:hypothetical protein
LPSSQLYLSQTASNSSVRHMTHGDVYSCRDGSTLRRCDLLAAATLAQFSIFAFYI